MLPSPDFRGFCHRLLATEILEDEEGRLEDAQIALGHKSRKTTEKYYTAITKKRSERVTVLKKKLWAEDEVLMR